MYNRQETIKILKKDFNTCYLEVEPPSKKMLQKILNLYKKSGETPLQTIERFRADNPEYQNMTLSYAGRLDPMAEGVLLVLVGEENKNREQYLNLGKEYSFDVLFGVSTDTYDILGLVKNQSLDIGCPSSGFSRLLLENSIQKFKGKFNQKYPPYSSRTVDGKQLWQWAREGAINKIKIPEREVEIHNITLVNIFELTKSELKETIIRKISLVDGDFRQKEILESWNNFFKQSNQDKFFVASFDIHCSSGTYVRSIASALGEQIGSGGALALKIIRTKVGHYEIS